jgi:AAA ATPase domain
MASQPLAINPYRPGAGHRPPYLAGRANEVTEFGNLLGQEVVSTNLIITGLRGVGKTVLLEEFRPHAVARGWSWSGTDLSESASVSEANMALRLITDLSLVTSQIVIGRRQVAEFGFSLAEHIIEDRLTFASLNHIYSVAPGLASDKLQLVLQIAWEALRTTKTKGIVFAYDEAQLIEDHSEDRQYPLSLLLQVFQHLQRKAIPFILVLAGLPTLLPKLVETRTYSERMFHVMILDRLSEDESRQAITRPIYDSKSPFTFDSASIARIIETSGGYPYFIQFICREVFDLFIQKVQAGERASVPVEEILRKLDVDFFFPRWVRATDRQRDLLAIVATLPNANTEFSVRDVVEASRKGPSRPFGGSQVTQMFAVLSDGGLIYKNRHGRYSFAVPMLGGFIQRQQIDFGIA